MRHKKSCPTPQHPQNHLKTPKLNFKIILKNSNLENGFPPGKLGCWNWWLKNTIHRGSMVAGIDDWPWSILDSWVANSDPCCTYEWRTCSNLNRWTTNLIHLGPTSDKLDHCWNYDWQTRSMWTFELTRLRKTTKNPKTTINHPPDRIST